MNKLLNKEIYRTINEAKEGELEQLEERSKSDYWKPEFHIHPSFGLMNDPNGLAYFNGEYHVFYQWHPFGPVHNMKHWAHVKSKNLVNWQRMPIAIIPNNDFDSHGAFSGGAIEIEDKLYLYYTGNIIYEDLSMNANQCLAIMDKEYKITKYKENPLINGTREGYTGHVRDPKVWKENQTYYMLLGAQRKNETGTLIIYESGDGINWSFKGEVISNIPLEGYMWECPDYFKLDGKDILVFSPQGVKQKGHDFQNLYNVVYVIGKFSLENLEFKVESIYEVDKGFDYYAPQSFEDSKGRRIQIGWAGMGEMDYPSDKNSWAHCLTIPRELILIDNKIFQVPVEELKLLRLNEEREYGEVVKEQKTLECFGRSIELEINIKEINCNSFGVKLFNSEEEEGLDIQFNKNNKEVIVDRASFINYFGGEYGNRRTAELDIKDEINLRIFSDNSIVEIFINGGELVFTQRIFPLKTSHKVCIYSDGKVIYDIKKYDMGRGIV